MRNVFSTVAKLAAVAGVAMTMSMVSTTVSSANDAEGYIKEYLDCLALLIKNDPSRVEKCGVGDAIFNTSPLGGGFAAAGDNSPPYCHCGYPVRVRDQWECHYYWEKNPN